MDAHDRPSLTTLLAQVDAYAAGVGPPPTSPLSPRCTYLTGHGGLHYAVREVCMALPQQHFVLKTDVRAYYASIDHQLLLDHLAVYITDRAVLNLMGQGLRRCAFGQREYQTARAVSEELLGLAQRQGDPALLLEAHFAVGDALFHLGELGAAHDHFVQGSALDDAAQALAHVVRYGQDTGLLCVSYVAVSRWFLGCPAQAQQWIARALARAHQLLAEVYGWFTEGFDTADLQEAKALLAALA